MHLHVFIFPDDNYANIISDDMQDTKNTLEAFISSLNVDCVNIGGDIMLTFHVLTHIAYSRAC